MPSTVFRYTWEEVNRDGREYALELDIHVDWNPFIPAKTNCDPDDGHPAEGGGFEVTEVVLDKVEEVLANGDRDEFSEEVRFGDTRRYWLARFAKEVEKTEQFRDWVGEQVDLEEERDDESDE